MKSQVNASPYSAAFACRSCARFSPMIVDAGLRQQREIRRRDVLARDDDLDVRCGPPPGHGRGRDPLAHLGEVRANALGGDAGDQLGHGSVPGASRHTTAA